MYVAGADQLFDQRTEAYSVFFSVLEIARSFIYLFIHSLFVCFILWVFVFVVFSWGGGGVEMELGYRFLGEVSLFFVVRVYYYYY